MSRHHRPVGPRITADEGKTLETLKNLWPHLWPASRPDLKRAVVFALDAGGGGSPTDVTADWRDISVRLAGLAP